MLTGTTIDDLTALVQRAESHAEHEEPKNLPPWIIKVPAGPRSKMLYGVGFTYGMGAA